MASFQFLVKITIVPPLLSMDKRYSEMKHNQSFMYNCDEDSRIIANRTRRPGKWTDQILQKPNRVIQQLEKFYEFEHTDVRIIRNPIEAPAMALQRCCIRCIYFLPWEKFLNITTFVQQTQQAAPTSETSSSIPIKSIRKSTLTSNVQQVVQTKNFFYNSTIGRLSTPEKKNIHRYLLLF